MAGSLKPMELVPDRKDGEPGEPLYQFRSERHYLDEINDLTSPERLPTIAKTLVDALNAQGGLKKPIEILVDGKYDELDDKLLGWLGNLPDHAKEKLIHLFERAEKHSEKHGRVGILFGLCFDPDVKDVQVSIPNVFQTELIPVVITAGPKVLQLTPQTEVGTL
jgi:hypothetical protein